MKDAVLEFPVTRDTALAHLADALSETATQYANASTEMRNEHTITEQTELVFHWQFTVCKDVAEREHWQRNKKHFSWTSRDTIGKFLNMYEFSTP